MGKKPDASVIVERMEKFSYPRDIIVMPKIWRKTVVNDKGQTQRRAMEILAEIVYWYRPSKGNATLTKGEKKFGGKVFQKKIADWAKEYDVSEKSIQRDLDFLQDDLHVIRKWTEKYKNNSGEVRSKPMCIELDVENLYRLTYPDGMDITKANEN